MTYKIGFYREEPLEHAIDIGAELTQILREAFGDNVQEEKVDDVYNKEKSLYEMFYKVNKKAVDARARFYTSIISDMPPIHACEAVFYTYDEKIAGKLKNVLLQGSGWTRLPDEDINGVEKSFKK